MTAAFCSLQLVIVAAGKSHFPEIQKFLQQLSERQLSRLTVNNCQQNRPKIGLQVSLLVKASENRFWGKFPLEFNHNSNPFAIALVTQIRNTVEAASIDQLRHLFNPSRLIYLKRKLRHHDRRFSTHLAITWHLFHPGHTPDRNAASTLSVGVNNALCSDDFPSCGKIRARNQFYQLLVGEFRVFNQSN